ncbi:hypothetical protein Tco_0914394 [Tanacetum coccineum]
MERKIDEWEKSQNISSEQTERTDPPPPQAHTEEVNAVFTKSEKSYYSPKILKDPPPPIIVNNKIEKDKPIKTSKKGYHVNVVANSTIKAEYIAASHCCGQVLWIQNQMLDYGYNFMQTKIHVENESAICVVKNLVYHSKLKHIKIRHHFIRDCYEKRLTEMVKIHTDNNIADLLTKAFDVKQSSMVGFEENVEFHQIVDFLSTCSINYALTLSSTIYASYIKQFWNTTTSKTVNSVKQIHVIVDGKAVVILELSVRSDLLFNDEDDLGADEVVHKERGDSVERAITTAASLDAAQDNDNIIKT